MVFKYDLQYNEIKKYKCIKDAVEESNGLFSTSKISDCCKGKRKHHRGFIWKYDNNEDLVIENIVLGKKAIIQYDKNYNLISKFNSIKEASKETGIPSSNICSCCKGKVITAGEFIWRYEKSEFHRFNLQKKQVIQYDKKMNELRVYESITDAVNITGIKTIWGCCSGRNKTAGGFIWKYKQTEK